MNALERLDWIVHGGYFAVLFGVAIWVILQKNKETEDYFLAGRNVGWFMIGASFFASNVGSEHVVGLAGAGAESGMPMAHYAFHAWIVLLLGWKWENISRCYRPFSLFCFHQFCAYGDNYVCCLSDSLHMCESADRATIFSKYTRINIWDINRRTKISS